MKSNSAGKINIICKLKCVNHSINGGVVVLQWKFPQVPCSLLSALAAMTQS